MKGTYRVYKGGLLVAEQDNLITNLGRTIILRYLAGNIGSFAGAIAAGAQHKAAVVTDTKLGFEFMRGAITVSAPMVQSNTVVYKASMPLNSAGRVYELGLYPHLTQTNAEYAGNLFIGFDPATESLTGGGANTTNYRTGAESYAVGAAAGASTTAAATAIRGNFGVYDPTDTFSLGYFLNDANTASIAVRLLVDSSNYFTYTVTTGTATGYFVADFDKSSFVWTGLPSWDNVTRAEFVVTARAGGATSVNLDGMRINDTDVYPEYALVSRTVLATPVTKASGEQMDIEYTLGFNL